MTTDDSDHESRNSEADEPFQYHRAAQHLIVVLATVLHFVFLVQARPLQSANDRSRWCTVWSLVERGTFQIDEIRQRPGWDTIDLIHVDQHFYSTKPPLLTTVVAGVTWLAQKATGWNLIDQLQPLTVVVLIVVNLIPFVVSLYVWIAILERVSQTHWTRLFVLTIAAFGTLLTPFLMTLNNHTVAATSITLALFGLIKLLSEDRDSTSIWPFVLCGFASSWAAVNELPAGLFLILTFVMACQQSIPKTLRYFIPASAIPLIGLLATNVIAMGTLKPAYADYGTDKYRFVIDGVPSYWMQPHGVDRNLDSPVMYFIHCTIGHHGLLSLTPIFVLGLAGWLISPTLRDRGLKRSLILGAVTSVIVLAFYMTRTQNYNYGGVSCALRWGLWLIPFWLLGLVPVIDQCSKSIGFRCLASGLTMISLFSAWYPIENPWRQPWLFHWMESRGWIDYSDPPVTLDKPLWTWFSDLPGTIDGDPAWIEFSIAHPGLESKLLRMTIQPAANAAGDLVEIEVREYSKEMSSSDRIRKLLVKVDPFQKGLPPAEFLAWRDTNVTAAMQQSDLAFVRGLPRKVPFEARAIRYLKTPLRTDAFECRQAAAHVSYAASDAEKPKNYRCDTWLNPEVPFGVVQVEFHLSDPETGQTLFHERWTVRDCHPKVQHVR